MLHDEDWTQQLSNGDIQDGFKTREPLLFILYYFDYTFWYRSYEMLLTYSMEVIITRKTYVASDKVEI